jgi:hypothetical protein
MKAGQRKQLETNVLADRLGKFVKGLKEGPSRTTWIVLGVIAAGVILFFVWQYFSKSSEEKDSARWYLAMRLFEGERTSTNPDDLGTATGGNERDLEKFAKDNEGTTQGRLARFYLARMALAQGEDKLGSRRETALANVRKASDLYEKLISESSDWPVLHMEAIMRSGKAREMLGDFDKAVEFYNQLISEYSKSAYVDEARDRVKKLEKGSDSRQQLDALYVRLASKSGT